MSKKPDEIPPVIPEKRSEMCRVLAKQLREMAGQASLKSRQEEILRQADEWDRIAQLAEDEEPKT